MPKPPPPPLLQPLTDDTPLAALLNRWLAALGPAVALLSPDRPSFARDCLRDADKGIRFFHEAVTQTMRRLESGRDLTPLRKYIRTDRIRRSLSQPVSAEAQAFMLALRGDRLRKAQDVHVLIREGWRLDKLLAQPSPFAADCALLRELFNGGWRATLELEESEPGNSPRRAYAVAILRCLLAADANALRHQVGTIQTRFPPVILSK